MAEHAQPLPELAGHVEGLREVMPRGRGETYEHLTSGHGDLMLTEDGLPSRYFPGRFGETDILIFRNGTPHPRFGDRLIVRRLDKALFGLVRHIPPATFEDITRRSRHAELRTNHLALRIDREVPELPGAPQVAIADREGMIEFWADIVGRLKADFSS